MGSKTLARARHSVLDAAEQWTEHDLNNRVSFLNGSPGVLAIAAVFCYKEGNLAGVQKYLEKLSIYTRACLSDAQAPDELLYGRAGYLYALLFVNTHIPEEYIGASVLKMVRTLRVGSEFAANVYLF